MSNTTTTVETFECYSCETDQPEVGFDRNNANDGICLVCAPQAEDEQEFDNSGCELVGRTIYHGCSDPIRCEQEAADDYEDFLLNEAGL